MALGEIFTVPDFDGSGPTGPAGALGTEDLVSVFTPLVGTSTQAIGTAFTKLVGIFSTNGQADGGTPDAAGSRIVITTPGTWRVYYALSAFTAAGTVFSVRLRRNSVRTFLESQHTMAASTESQSAMGTLVLGAGDVLELAGRLNNPVTVTYRSAALCAKRLA